MLYIVIYAMHEDIADCVVYDVVDDIDGDMG